MTDAVRYEASPLFPYLYDGIAEDGFQEHGWLWAELAATPEEASERIAREVCDLEALNEDEVTPFAPATERVYMRPVLELDADALDPDFFRELVGERDGVRELPVGTRELVGSSVVRAVEKDPSLLEEVWHVRCEPDDDGAFEWWKVPLA